MSTPVILARFLTFHKKTSFVKKLQHFSQLDACVGEIIEKEEKSPGGGSVDKSCIFHMSPSIGKKRASLQYTRYISFGCRRPDVPEALSHLVRAISSSFV